MGTVTITLPDKALEALKERAKAKGKELEEFVGEVIFKQLEITDPETKAELHLKLCEKYMNEAENLLTRKEYTQASEKAWGAASQMVKAVAAKEKKELRSHAALWEYVDELAERLKDIEVRHLWSRATNLHQNFYENWMPSRDVELSVKDVKTFLEKLKKIK
jgi:uncharacterized protein (UPF0332 family)